MASPTMSTEAAGPWVITAPLPTSVVQGWISTPANNAGMLLVQGVSGNNTSIASAEAATVANRPKLLLDIRKRGDFNSDGVADALDIDLLFTQTAGAVTYPNDIYDADRDGSVNPAVGAAGSDADYWVQNIKNTKYGDADLNGKVNFSDLLTLATNYGVTTGAGWAMGSFNGDGAVNFGDLLALASNYGFDNSPTGTFAGDWALAQSLVPEPTTLALGFGVALPMLRRRR